MPWQKIALYLGLPALVLSAVGSSWAVADWLGVRPVLSRELAEVQVEVAAVTSWVQLSKWKELEAKRERQGLTPNERVEFCHLSRLLGFKGEGCA